jgi:hypothetical protein
MLNQEYIKQPDRDQMHEDHMFWDWQGIIADWDNAISAGEAVYLHSVTVRFTNRFPLNQTLQKKKNKPQNISNLKLFLYHFPFSLPYLFFLHA